MFTVLLWGILIYFLVRFVVGFVIPVARTARQMKKQMKDFQEKMHGQTGFEGHTGQQQTAQKPAEKPKEGEYIDFEEVK
jgi:hypothetical protein